MSGIDDIKMPTEESLYVHTESADQTAMESINNLQCEVEHLALFCISLPYKTDGAIYKIRLHGTNSKFRQYAFSETRVQLRPRQPPRRYSTTCFGVTQI